MSRILGDLFVDYARNGMLYFVIIIIIIIIYGIVIYIISMFSLLNNHLKIRIIAFSLR